jgi:ribosome-associated heat shock protein Hsp15
METTSTIRIDKWLWAARFFKTRTLATEAVNGGKVHLNQQRTKPAKEVHVGDELTIRTGYVERKVIVTALSIKRGGAKDAALLYEETPESIEQRERAAQLHRQEVASRPNGAGRPTKKERRAIERFKRDNLDN